MAKRIFIINAHNQKEPFSINKVRQSAIRAGASRVLAQTIAQNVARNVFEGQRTSEIFDQIKRSLDQDSPKAALRFNLKKAMRRLGPSGFAFEKYTAAIYEHLGYQTELNPIITGECLEHEVDFLAQKNGKMKIVECKFHNHPRGQVDTSVILEYYSRFNDIVSGGLLKKRKVGNGGFLILTNSKFNTNAIRYANCVGIELLGWNYPQGRGLAWIIESQNLYPITILPSLNKNMFEILLKKGIIFAKDVFKLGSNKQFNQLISEAKTLLG